MFCSSPGVESSGARADTGPATTLGEASAAQADNGASASLENGQGVAVGTMAPSVAPQPHQDSLAQQALPFHGASLVLPANHFPLPSLLLSTSISEGCTEAASFQPLSSFAVPQTTSQAAVHLPGCGFDYSGPLSGVPPRSNMPARHTHAGILQPAVQAQLAMCGPSLTDHIAGRSIHADW